MGHKCPSPGCSSSVPSTMLACRPHWYSIPKPLRVAVWDAWNGGEGSGSAAHLAAISAAIRYLKGGNGEEPT